MKHPIFIVCSVPFLVVSLATSVFASRLEGTFSHDTSADQLLHFRAGESGQVTIVNRATVNVAGDMEGAAHCIVLVLVDTSTNVAAVSGSCVFVGTVDGAQKVLQGTATLDIDLASGDIEGGWRFEGGGPNLSVSGGIEGVVAAGSYSGVRGRR